MDATSTTRHSSCVILNRNSTLLAFVVLLVKGPHTVHPCFISNTLTFEENPIKSYVLVNSFSDIVVECFTSMTQ